MEHYAIVIRIMGTSNEPNPGRNLGSKVHYLASNLRYVAESLQKLEIRYLHAQAIGATQSPALSNW